MLELFELRVYPKPEDAYEDNGVFITVADKVTLEKADEILGHYFKQEAIEKAEVVAVSHTDEKKYFAPRDGFDWMEINETNNI
jgi:hypothetical protein